MKKIIYLQKIGEIDEIILKKLKKDLELALKEYIKSVVILPNIIPLADSDYDPIRKQYNASLIIEKLLGFVSKKQLFRILGVIDKDIFSRPLFFVFGIAISPKKPFSKSSGAALISVKRLREEFYRRERDRVIFELRVLKEAIHEIGHTFGLKHCNNKCIMQFSNCLSDTDKKPPIFCESCSRELKVFFNNLK